MYSKSKKILELKLLLDNLLKSKKFNKYKFE